jgi:arylsulfatase A-like enzyme
VPLIARWPGKIKPGSVSDLPCANWDVLPTAANIAGIKPPENLDGLSIVPTLLGQPQTNRHEFLFWEFHERGFQQAVRYGDWKAVRREPDKPLELFDLKKDTSEKENVADANPQVAARIEGYFKTARTESAEWPAVKSAKKKK